jgi:anti-sigma-K factor RskA
MTEHGPPDPDDARRPPDRGAEPGGQEGPDRRDLEDARDLLAAYVLDAVDDEHERSQVEALLAVDTLARDEVRRYEDAIAALAADDVAVEPPPGTWAAIQARIAASARPPVSTPTAPVTGAVIESVVPTAAELPADQHGDVGQAAIEEVGELAPVVALDRRARRRQGAAPRPRWRIIGVAAAVVVLVVAAAAAIGLSQQGDNRNSELVAALESPDSRVGSLSGSAGEARVVLTADGRGYLTTSGLERPAEGKVYQLWLGDSGTMVSLGVVDDSGVSRFEAPAGSNQLALSLEQRPGAAQPTLPPVATGELA